mmetsp:Transcript_43754/g.103368  ORF Transcript_43754/g.103368 Transcript_43754/m.103368 type:complete len:106 (+) Transcript_43754:84-401(+)|eukprot:CAMPEP_0178402112 /NCGR_PEP_ID=MMETSP0689_2-20121128/16667_1 /TAXON_ID=160604 /ORGANISM="Amphidinium massartii, Strain CS-259" /LENGTH=105 /DNA_ID=CAMNT_0020022989 /DNA_START=84 /DNA_END=401 /DNA_ORIENTATION=+
MAMLLRSAARVASSRSAAPQVLRTTAAVSQQQFVKMCQSPLANTSVRSFGAVVKHKEEKAVARPFPGASRSEPEMEYIEEPSMLYMVCLFATPFCIMYWGLTKFV